ncbi:hypothetical protein SHK09_15115 [Polaribacter sp. PL03]|uniref:hypothetical protein n=1 Tax=Polaribacter sp. PL03 TaxID=3088353 RepID=UPI0029CE9CDF|nr:hypothetical protein [Polaribacter sp. PL03]MDX6748126.1 hypothetical protein [Polaribacter sp. PL03]
MRILLLLLVLNLTLGCATRNIKYDRNKILKKYSAEYKMFVDNEKTELETVFLDKDNIENIRIDKRTKELKITQLKRTELFEMKNLNLDSLSAGQRGWNKKKIELVIIDGIPLTDSLLEKTKIDPNAIKSFNILSQEMMEKTNFCRVYNGSVILITTK